MPDTDTRTQVFHTLPTIKTITVKHRNRNKQKHARVKRPAGAVKGKREKSEEKKLRKKTVLALVLVVLTLSLTAAALAQQGGLTQMRFTQPLTLQPAKSMTMVWGSEERANTHTTYDQHRPSVCCFPDGSGFVVVWHSYAQDGNGYGVFAKVFNSTGGNLTGDTGKHIHQ
ncbi:MAG: hypothetical protein ACTSSA_06340 [Candidatus Freyarchaeota archaeon]